MCTHVLSNIRLRYEELRAQILFRNSFMISKCDRSDASQDEVLGHFIRERFDRDEQDVGGADPAELLAFALAACEIVTYFS